MAAITMSIATAYAATGPDARPDRGKLAPKCVDKGSTAILS
jgi:hypothetical protein